MNPVEINNQMHEISKQALRVGVPTVLINGPLRVRRCWVAAGERSLLYIAVPGERDPQKHFVV